MSRIVTSYPNPDTDGVACIIAVASYYGFAPVIQGRLSAETDFVLKKVGLEAPQQFDKFEYSEEIILVDTHHLAQIGKDFPSNKVVRIIDHHPGGDTSAFINAKIDNRAIGAAASIVGEMYLQSKEIRPSICKLLQYAIASNTLLFTAPATSLFDKDIFHILNERHHVSEKELNEMMDKRTGEDITSDIKYFDFTGGRIAIAQLEKRELDFSVEEVKIILDRIDKQDNLLFSIFNGVNISKKESTVVFSSGINDVQAMKIFPFRIQNGISRVDRILLRKTDFVPAIVGFQEK